MPSFFHQIHNNSGNFRSGEPQNGHLLWRIFLSLAHYNVKKRRTYDHFVARLNTQSVRYIALALQFYRQIVCFAWFDSVK